jgi:hypothetical protein
MPHPPGWIGIAANLWLNRDYYIAVRDVNMAIAAFALGRLSSVREHRAAGDWDEPSQAAFGRNLK